MASSGYILQYAPTVRQNSSRRLNGNLTSLDSAACAARGVLNLLSGGSAASIEGALPLTAIGEANFAYPLLFYFYKRSEATFVVILNRQSQSKFKNTARGRAALSRRVKLPFRQRLWGKTAMACVLKVRTHCSFFPETLYQR